MKSILMRERRLILDSEIINDYPDIKAILEENKRINQDFINKLPQKHKIFFKNILPFVLKEATNEWKGDEEKNICEDMGPDRSKWKRCSLDNRHNRYIFYIVNTLNGKRLNVGSCCIKQFWEGELEGKTIKQMIEERKRLRLLSALDERFPDIARTINNWGAMLENFAVIIPYSFETPYLELGKDAKETIEHYLGGNHDGEHKLVERLDKIFHDQKVLLRNIQDHVAKVANDKFAPTKNIRVWLRTNPSATTKEALNQIKKHGLITWSSAWRIEEYNFMQSLISDLNKALRQIGISIINIDRSRKGYILRCRGQKSIKLFAIHRELILDCGWVLFANEESRQLYLENIIKYCTIYEESSINEVIYKLNGVVKNRGIRFGYPDFDHNEIDLFDEKTKTYMLLNLKKIAEEYKGLVIGCRDKHPKDLEQYISDYKGKRYSKEQLSDLRQSRKEFNIVQY